MLLNGTGEVIDDYEYPATTEELMAEHGDRVLELPNGTETVEDVLARLESETFHSPKTHDSPSTLRSATRLSAASATAIVIRLRSAVRTRPTPCRSGTEQFFLESASGRLRGDKAVTDSVVGSVSLEQRVRRNEADRDPLVFGETARRAIDRISKPSGRHTDYCSDLPVRPPSGSRSHRKRSTVNRISPETRARRRVRAGPHLSVPFDVTVRAGAVDHCGR